jgi:cell division protein FtsL
MSFATRAGLAVLAIGLGATAIGVVSTKHEARSLFIQLQGLNGERDAL